MIIVLKVEPDKRLTVEPLARDLDVSATPIRGAIARLESEGRVTRTQAAMLSHIQRSVSRVHKAYSKSDG
jgi:DNA-binding GntR family transcriptional regulator